VLFLRARACGLREEVEGLVHTWPLSPLSTIRGQLSEPFSPLAPPVLSQDSEYFKNPSSKLFVILYYSKMSGTLFCDLCQCDVPSEGWNIHVEGRAHCRKAGIKTENALQSAQRDRNGISIPSQDADLDFGVVDPSAASRAEKSFTLKVTSKIAEFMVLDPQWTSSALRPTACVNFAWCHTSPNELTLPADFHVVSKVTLISSGVTQFASLWPCESLQLVVTKTPWR
jgi:hypothetical protein